MLHAVGANLDLPTIYSTSHWHPALLRWPLQFPSLETSGDTKSNHLLRSTKMNNRNQPTQARIPMPSPAPALTPTHLNVFNVEEYERDGKTQKRWTKIGAAFPHKEGTGFSIELRAFPVDGRLVVLPPDNGGDKDDRSK